MPEGDGHHRDRRAVHAAAGPGRGGRNAAARASQDEGTRLGRVDRRTRCPGPADGGAGRAACRGCGRPEAGMAPGGAGGPDPWRGGGGCGGWRRGAGQRGAATRVAVPVPPVRQPGGQRGRLGAVHGGALARHRVPARAADASEGGQPGRAGRGRGERAMARRRGRCRQAAPDLRVWRPGQHKPGSRSGARYASTLWGWQRRWLGGADAGRAAAARPAVRPRLRSNDVAASVLARRWLSSDRGFGGPVLRYDRILPEFCHSCGSKVHLVSVAGPGGRTQVQRAACCGQQHLFYRSEFIERDGRRLLRPKLGIVVASQSREGGNAGYSSTEPLGPIWLCRQCGRYSRAAGHCPECGPGRERAHERVHHGWVLLPLAAAWADLEGTAGPADDDTAGTAADDVVGETDLAFLADVCSQLLPREQRQLGTPADVWALAKGWSTAEMNAFRSLAGLRGLELLFHCRQIAEAPHLTAGALKSPMAEVERCDGPGGERT